MNYPYAIPGTTAPFTGPYFEVGNECCDGGMSNDINAKTLVMFDYTGQLTTGTNVNSVAYTVTPTTVPPLLISGESLTSNVSTFYVSGGIIGQQYVVESSAQISTGEIWIDKILVTVTDCLATPYTGPGILYGSGPVVLSKSLYYIATSAQTVFPLSVADHLGQTGLLASSNVTVYTNGSRLVPGDSYTVDVINNQIILTQPAGVGESVIFDLVASPSTGTVQMDRLVVVIPNLLPNLSLTPDGNMLILFYKGLAYFPVTPNPDFSFAGDELTWLRSDVTLPVGGIVYATYTHN